MHIERHMSKLNKAIPQDLLHTYYNTVDSIRDSCIELPKHVRPHCRESTRMDATGVVSGKLVRPEPERLIPESTSHLKHMVSARNVLFPFEKRDTNSPQDDLIAAANFIIKNKDTLGSWRRNQIRILSDASKALAPLSSWLKLNASVPSSVLKLSQPIHVALIAAQIDAIDWLDKGLALAFLTGMPALGAIPVTGVFRPVQTMDRN